MLALIPLVPFIGFLVNASLGRRLSRGRSAAIATGAVVLSCGLSLVAAWQLLAIDPANRAVQQAIYTWMTSGDFSVRVAFRLDPLSALMILVVTGIGSLIHIYSSSYMEEEAPPEYARYFAYLNLFVAFMLVLVLASNFLVMFVGWEGVGLSSYLLIGFWYRKKTATDAGKKAFIVNRVGDFGFLLGMLLIVVHFGTLEFHEVAAAASRFSPELAFGTLSAITLLLFVGAAGKSAQIPLYVWLPDAMEGPTPVSALIHAATIGLVQNDIKRVLAYSTVSQLGYMMLAMGVGAYASGIFHLYTHAFFKALLFLGSGAVIHALAGEQDIRRMGGLRHDLPLTYWTFLIGALAIAGVPGLSGFFSKDAILFETFASGHTLLWAVGIITSLLTAVYMFRLVFLTFHGERASGGSHLHDAPYPMAVALVILAVGSAAAGWVSLGGRFDEFLQPALEAGPHEASAAGEPHDTRLELVLMGVATAVAVSGIAIAWYLFVRSRAEATRLAERFAGVHRTLERKYYVDELYDAAIVQPVRLMAENGLWKIVDVAGIDRVVNGTASAIASMSAMLRRLQTGSVRAYAASLVLGAVLIVGYYLWT